MANQMSHTPNVSDKPRFLHRLMIALAGDARLSLEGELSHCRFPEEIVVGSDETSTLKRHTLYPRQDFVVLRLSPETVEPIFKQVMAAGLKRAIIHVQVERSGVLELGAYDNFHPDCVTTGPAVSLVLLEELKSTGVLHDFGKAEDGHG